MTNYIFTTTSGEEIPVVMETRRGLRNITLRPQTIPKREIHISKPWLSTTGCAIRFLEQKGAWIEKIFNAAPKKCKIQDGDVLEIFGRRVQIRHDPTKRSNCWFHSEAHPRKFPIFAGPGVGVDANEVSGRGGLPEFENGPNRAAAQLAAAPMDWTLVIGGAPEMMERRVRDFIKKEFLAQVKKIIKTTPPEFHPPRLSIKDTSSRWGSRSSTGTISFSWRLAFAPYDVMRYVVMHELSHIKHMDHSAAFWRQVSALYGPGAECAREWLSRNGQKLHIYF
ncbi:MAG: M48 family metallopeptidase [Rickettsiales bacterium]|jgi:predicted metal-dependent hydrolase|nr:M48 family metallopeptidase [Rickettsiales bacterium]